MRAVFAGGGASGPGPRGTPPWRLCHPEGEPCEREGSGRADLSVPQILWVAEAPRRMTSGSRGAEVLRATRRFSDVVDQGVWLPSGTLLAGNVCPAMSTTPAAATGD